MILMLLDMGIVLECVDINRLAGIIVSNSLGSIFHLNSKITSTKGAFASLLIIQFNEILRLKIS